MRISKNKKTKTTPALNQAILHSLTRSMAYENSCDKQHNSKQLTITSYKMWIHCLINDATLITFKSSYTYIFLNGSYLFIRIFKVHTVKTFNHHQWLICLKGHQERSSLLDLTILIRIQFTFLTDEKLLEIENQALGSKSTTR